VENGVKAAFGVIKTLNTMISFCLKKIIYWTLFYNCGTLGNLSRSATKTMVNLSEDGCPVTHPCHGLVSDIKNLVVQVALIKFFHTF
jgi:hypothetical protein